MNARGAGDAARQSGGKTGNAQTARARRGRRARQPASTLAARNRNWTPGYNGSAG